MKLFETFNNSVKLFNIKYRSFMIFYIAIAIILSFSNLIVYLTEGKISKYLVDSFAKTGDVSSLIMRMIVTAILLIFFETIRFLVTERTQIKIQKLIRIEIVTSFTKIYNESISKNGIGGLLSLLVNDSVASARLLTGRSLELLYGLISSLIYFICLFLISVHVTTIYLFLFIVVVLVQHYTSRPISNSMRTVMEKKAVFNSTLTDILYNHTIINAYSLEKKMETRFLDAYNHYFDANLLFLKKLIPALFTGAFCSKLPLYLTYALISFEAINGKIQINEFVTFVLLVNILSPFLESILENVTFIKQDTASTNRIMEYLNEKKETNLINNGNEEYSDIAIKFDDVSHTFNRVILNKCSFSINKGECVLIKGESGSGKSTILRLLCGLEELLDGEITIMGNRLKDSQILRIRDNLSYVSQDYKMMNLSVKDNIVLRSNVQDEYIWNVLELVGLKDKISRLPKGLDTIIDEGGENFSGGEKQRLAIARTIIEDKSIILLDEPTSALDAESFDLIRKVISEVWKGKTIIIVTHNDEKKLKYNRLLHLESGLIYER